jgi:hypothetical protein
MAPSALSHGDCAPGAGAEDCITSAGGLSSGAAPVVSTSCLSSPALQRQLWLVVCWVDILLDVIGGVESALLEGFPRTMTGVSQCWFSGHFRQLFFKHQCITPH